MRYLISLLLFLLLFTTSEAQPYYYFNTLGKTDGLSNNHIREIAQDGQGFVWIATEAGLDRFDGKNFTTYNTVNSELNNTAINTLLYDETENKLWIGTNANLSILDCATLQFKNYKDFDGIPLQNIVHLAHGADNDIWITNLHLGVVRYDKKTKKALHFNDDEIKGFVNYCRCTYDDRKGNLYIGHAMDGLTVLDLINNTIRHFRHDPVNPKSLPGNSVYAIKEGSSGNVWIGTNQGLCLFNPRKEEFIVFRHYPQNPSSLIGNQVTQIEEMKDGSLWISTEVGGISILDLYDLNPANPESVRFTNITTQGGLSSENIKSLMQDAYGNIWIGNTHSGIDIIRHIPPAFHILPYTVFHGKKLQNIPVWGVYSDSEQQVWAGGENKAVIFKENKLSEKYDLTPYRGKYSTSVSAFMEDGHGNILLGLTQDGLIQFDRTAKRFRRLDYAEERLDVITFFDDKEIGIWIGTHEGLFTYANGTLEKQKEITSQLFSRSVRGITRDQQGKLWVGTHGSGLFVFNKENKLISELSVRNGFFSNAINQLYLDSKGGVWVATRNKGLAYIADTSLPEIYEKYDEAQGLDDLFIRAIQEDKFGNMWFSTNSGISFWDRKKGEITNYDYHSGLPLGNFTDGSATIDDGGTIYFGSFDGVCYFNPEDVMVVHKIPPVRIVECKVFQTQVENSHEDFFVPPVDKTISLKHYQNSFRIFYSVPDYALNEQAEYAYMVEGLQEVWSNTDGDNQVTFRNIPPGNYVFKVKARLKNQDWDEEHIAALRLHIHPPFWLTGLAKLLYGIAICYLVFLFVRSYKRKLALKSSLEVERRNSQNEIKLNQERLQFYTNITHELRTPLTLILGPLEDLKIEKGMPDRYRKRLNAIYNSAGRLLGLINQLLEFRKTETRNRKLTVSKADIVPLVTEIGLYYTELNRNQDVKFHINIETERTMLYYDAEVVTIILNNLLSNAVKYTPVGEIDLTLTTILEEGDEWMEIKVSDTGSGIDAEALPLIFDRYYQAKGKHQASGTGIGLSIVKSLADLHKGRITVESEPGKGSTFIFRIPTDDVYAPEDHSIEIPANLDSLNETINESVNANEDDEADSLLILVVEDNKDIREYISSSLSGEYAVITAENGKEGLELAREKIPNVIISDIMMPEMDGIEFCAIIKEDMLTSHIPVILLTAKDSIQDREKGYESGADSYITKPFSASLLSLRIHNLLESRDRLAQQVMKDINEMDEQKKSLMGTLDNQFITKLTTLIKDNMAEPRLDVSFLKDELKMSYISFNRKVKALTGLSPNEFIRKIKLKTSLDLLLNDTYNISEVAYQTGFSDPRYFRRCFKEEYGLTPTEYIRKVRER